MARKVPQKPAPAYIEDYDDDADSVIPQTRQSAHIAAKRSKTALVPLDSVPIDFASDSGYSSRTAATGNSSQSRASARPSPMPLTLDTIAASRPVEAVRVKEGRKDKGKQRQEKRASADMMHMNARAAPPPRSSSTSRRQSINMHAQPDAYWAYANGYPNAPGYPVPAPVDYSSYYYYQQSTPTQDIPPQSPQTGQYPYPSYGHAQGHGPEMHIAQSTQRQRRPSRASVYNMDERPLSYHAGMPNAMYNPGALPATPYEQGPPPAPSAYHTMPSTPHQQYYAEPGSPYQQVFEKQRASSVSRPKEQRRRSSVYGRPVIEHTTPKASFEDGSFLERQISREHRSRRPSESRRPVETEGLDEDYYRMPPPPPPAPKPKAKAPKIIQKRPEPPQKSMTTGSVPPTSRRMSHSRDSWDLSDLKQALPHQQIRKIAGVPERSQSMKATRRTSYHAPDGARRIIEGSRRRTNYYDDEHQPQREPRRELPIDLEQKHRSAEEYQAAKSGRTGVPLTADALRLKAKIAQRQDSDSGSQKSRSNSSRGSDARTRDGSGVGSRFDDDSSFTMTMNGMTMTFPQGSVSGKTIHLRTDEQGAIGLNIEGRRPKKYIMPAGSEFTSASSRREVEDGRRPRDDRRSDRNSRRSSRSTFSGR
ncbi:hypothetical protein BGW36DRAFT_364891 [Talaromyces proteolyticus]|uniref:Uncharacterized protein n=1 Tax=Talaromyces proteolyticus TaxID=1131652 RepID=A0AAD4KE87_9EURO|nr:uncharacterized protein BGW36DRAFT_364891 [Talaromyces proteolyticus]KAH8690167.1 hypothetical protein BGW36DRAFT_364891 [Talaromyces proteolyticus]